MVMDNFLIQQNTMLPRGYGVAWRKHDQDCTVVMPIPLNVLASWVRRAWHWLRVGVRPSAIDEAYARGRGDASNDHMAHLQRVRERAYRDGETQGREGEMPSDVLARLTASGRIGRTEVVFPVPPDFLEK